MPLAARNNLDELYARQRLIQAEHERLELERASLRSSEDGAMRRYLIDLLMAALEEEEAKLGSSISDILERDLQR